MYDENQQMTKRSFLIKNRISIAITGLLFIAFGSLQAQVLKDTSTFALMRKGVDYIYNMQIDKAYEIYQKVEKIYPDHPIMQVYKGLITYWDNYPLITNSPKRASFEESMLKAIDLCESKSNHETDPEFLLANIGARGLLLMYYADNDLTKNVISVASGTYQYVKASFKHTQSYADFYFVTGLYNYYREAYPESHPVYKSVAFLFPKGDRGKGLKQLQYASKNAVILKAESYSFLSGIYISFENNFQQAYIYSKALHELYPLNAQYLAVYIKSLLLIKRYNEAEELIRVNRSIFSNKYFQAQLHILNGIITEKKYHNPQQAKDLYLKGIKEIEPFGEFGNELKAYGYFGLSRIEQDKQLKKEYRKKALEKADFKNVNFDR